MDSHDNSIALVRRGSPDPAETADRRSPVPGTFRRRFCAREKETSGHTFRQGQETRAEQESSHLSVPFPIFLVFKGQIFKHPQNTAMD
jgi:hypothetical protein